MEVGSRDRVTKALEAFWCSCVSSAPAWAEWSLPEVPEDKHQ